MYKKWVPKGQLRAETEMDLSGPSAKKMKLDDATVIQQPILLNMIEKLRDEPFDKEYAEFLNEKSPVFKIMGKGGWTKSVGLGKKGRKGNLRVVSSLHFTFMIYGDKTIVIKIVKSRHPQSDQGHSS